MDKYNKTLHWEGKERYGPPRKKISHPSIVFHSWVGSQRYRTFPWGVKDSSSTLGIPTLSSYTGETNPQNTWHWKPTETTELQWKKFCSYRDHAQIHCKQKPVRKQQLEKAHRPQVKGTHFWMPYRKAGGSRDSPRVWNTDDSHFCDLVLLCWCQY